MHPRAYGRLIAGLFIIGAVAAGGRSAGACPPDQQGIAVGCFGLPDPAQAPEFERITHPAPAVERQEHRKGDGGEHSPQKAALPVRIIESDVNSAHAETRETKADEYDAKNLETEIRTAKATEDQATATWAAVIVSTLGTLLLIGTLWETRSANKLNRVAYVADQRPWVSIEVGINGELTWDEQGLTIPLEFMFENVGKTPALHVAFGYDFVTDEGAILKVEAGLADRELRQMERRGQDHHDFGVISTVFPGKKAVLEDKRFIPKPDLDTAAATRDLVQARFEAARGIRPMFVGCVTYRRTFDRSVAQTSFSFQVFREDGSRERKGFLPAHLPLAAEQAGVWRWPDGRVT